MKKLFCDHVFLQTGWAENVLISINDHGTINTVQTDASPDPKAEHVSGYVMPGIANAHSHAFQRAMAGLAEYSSNPKDSFWTWRELMYDFAGKISPDDLYDIAAFLYMEMLEAGYTSVAEFHYLHNAPNGQPYDDPAIMSKALLQAAKDVGIRLTLLPVLYMQGGFGGRSLNNRQKRFENSIDSYLDLLTILKKETDHIGVAFHSLRAVAAEAFAPVLDEIGKDTPVHIHIAEQQAEIDECLAATGQRPVEWALNHLPLNDRWNMVHATHMTPSETERLAQTKTVAVICPSTEGNLGDSLFPLDLWQQHKGRIAIGSDSHISIDPFEELRWLEYGQRLHHQRRAIYTSPNHPHTGENLIRAMQESASSALGHPLDGIKAGQKADMLVIKEDIPGMNIAQPDQRFDNLIFANRPSAIKNVMVNGSWQLQDTQHQQSEGIRDKYQKCLTRLINTEK